MQGLRHIVQLNTQTNPTCMSHAFNCAAMQAQLLYVAEDHMCHRTVSTAALRQKFIYYPRYM